MKKTITFSIALIVFFVLTLVAVATTFLSCNTQKNASGTLSELSASEIERVLSAPEKDGLTEEYIEATKGMSSLLKPSDIVLPADLVSADNTFQPFGLMGYNGNSFVPYDSENVFDENKKTVFYIHGMGANGVMPEYRKYYENGYNVFCFWWGALADEPYLNMPLVSEKVWTYDGSNRFRSALGDDWHGAEPINYSVAEIYAASYCALFSAHPKYKGEITVAGHSFGGMVTCGLLSYLTAAFRNGLILAQTLPDRAILLDPYFMKGNAENHVRWLNDSQIGDYNGGLTFLSYQAVLFAKRLGITVSLIRTSYFIGLPMTFSYDSTEKGVEMQNNFYDSVLYIDAPATDFLGLSEGHNYSYVWTFSHSEPLFDSLYPKEYAVGINNPRHAEYARMGEAYSLDFNKTEDIDDDVITVKEKKKTKLYGFVFFDENKNGDYDDKICNNIYGAKVTIKSADGVLISETTTSLDGYFETRVSAGEYVISVSLSPDYGSVSDKKVTVADNQLFVHSLFGVSKK